MHYIVLGGGSSPEKDVSRRSAAAVVEALVELGHETTYVDPATVSAAELIERASNSDGVLPILHGAGGEDGEVQAMLESAGVPYLGPDVTACEATYDKTVFKRILEKHDLPTPKWSIVNRGNWLNEPLAKKPFVVKTFSGGSSIDTFIVRSFPYDDTPILEALDRYGEMLIEELIAGHEITVGVLGNDALPVVEIIPPDGKEFDYENKYNGATRELCPPVNISEDLQIQAQDLALKTHIATRCRHLSRTDIMINSEGNMFIIDTNTIPGLTKQSLYPKAAAQAGYSWTKLVEEFIKMMR